MAETAGNVFGPIDAETNDMTQFTGTGLDVGSTFAATAGSKNNGSYGFEAMCENGDNDCLAYKTFTTNNDMYARAYFKLPAGGTYTNTSVYWGFEICDGSVSIFLFRLYWISASSTWGYAVSLRANDAALKPIVNRSTTSTFAADTWYRVELRGIIGGVGTGGVQCWIDGVSVGSDFATYDNTNYDNNRIYIGNHGYTTVAGNDYAYFDDIKGDTSYIGAYAVAGGHPAMKRFGGVPHMAVNRGVW